MEKGIHFTDIFGTEGSEGVHCGNGVALALLLVLYWNCILLVVRSLDTIAYASCRKTVIGRQIPWPHDSWFEVFE